MSQNEPVNPPVNHVRCSVCNRDYPTNRFSRQGQHTEARKRYCIHCESRKRKASKCGLTLAQFDEVLLNDCSICGNKAEFVDTWGDQPIGVFCSKCNRLLKIEEQTLFDIATYVYNRRNGNVTVLPMTQLPLFKEQSNDVD